MASVALSAGRERRTENVFYMLVPRKFSSIASDNLVRRITLFFSSSKYLSRSLSQSPTLGFEPGTFAVPTWEHVKHRGRYQKL